MTGEGSRVVPRVSDDRDVRLGRRRRHPGRPKAFAAAGAHGTSVLVALTAQNTVAVTGVHELPPEFILDAARGRLRRHRRRRREDRDALLARDHRDGGRRTSNGAPRPARRRPGDDRQLGRAAAPGRRRRDADRAALSARHGRHAQPPRGGGADGDGGASRRELAERLVELGAAAALVTGGHGEDAVDHLFDGSEHLEIPVERHAVAATHGAGCTHSATLAALLARGLSARGGRARRGRAASRGGPERPRRARRRRRPRRRLRPERSRMTIDPGATLAAPRAQAARPQHHELRRHERDRERDPRARRAAGDGAREGGGEEMAGLAGALVLNIGTLSEDWVDAMLVAGARRTSAASRSCSIRSAPGRPRTGRDREADPRRGRRDRAARERGRGRDARRRRGRGARRRVDRRGRRRGRARARGGSQRSGSSPRSPARSITSRTASGRRRSRTATSCWPRSPAPAACRRR